MTAPVCLNVLEH